MTARPLVCLFAIATTALGATSTGIPKPFAFFNISPDMFASYPACDTPEGEHKICRAGYMNEKHETVFMELRPDSPKFLSSNIWVSVNEKGEPTHYFVRTGGAIAQNSALEYLQTIYGRPKTIKHVAFQNAYGASIPGIEATWTVSKQYEVEFKGISDKLDEGQITAFKF